MGAVICDLNLFVSGCTSHPNMIKLLFLCTLLAMCAQQARALYSAGSSVIELTPSNFNKLVINSNEVWIVEFYAPWCGHCKQLVPDYIEAWDGKDGHLDVEEEIDLSDV